MKESKERERGKEEEEEKPVLKKKAFGRERRNSVGEFQKGISPGSTRSARVAALVVSEQMAAQRRLEN